MGSATTSGSGRNKKTSGQKFCPSWLIALFLSLLLSACQLSGTEDPEPHYTNAAIVDQEDLYRPGLDLGELFANVQMQGIFADSKTFPDSVPRTAPSAIVLSYHAKKDDANFDLHTFVDNHFAIPQAVDAPFTVDTDLSMEQHLREHWPYLTRNADKQEPRSSLIPLPYPYVVPGGRFREIYYWDSYFTMHGLVASDRMDLTEQMLNNFAWLIDQFGLVPNGNRSYYLSRSQPPFFAAMVSLVQTQRGDRVAAKYLPALVKEYAFWMEGADNLAHGEARRRVVRLKDGTVLNRYYDDLEQPRPESYREDVHIAQQVTLNDRPRMYRDIRAAAESGWDFSSRWFGDRTHLHTIETIQIIPVDLNSLLYHLEKTISHLYGASGDPARANLFAEKARTRKDAINQWLWEDTQQVYGDYHLQDKGFTGVQSLAMVYPLYFGISTQSRAEAVAEQLQTHFLKAGGLVTTLNDTGEQWDYPNGWAPLQWLAIRGLRNYGLHHLSDEIASRWLDLNRKVFQETGRMMEKYNVVDTTLPAGGGEYPLQDGFGWTNGVVLALTAEAETSASAKNSP